ncbi:DUF1508 domain-containing protein [Haloplanus rallus]|uniref:DUF1508 domain-containing protein n=1 Tax=Haloplanus rallus TaxID=1816183 RepID=A0A6B9FH57_9EURY|nr:DUF1508 domain-containing protein [Haloplanus rallus]
MLAVRPRTAGRGSSASSSFSPAALRRRCGRRASRWAASDWRWRLRHRNGNVLADGGEGYASRSGVHDAIEGVKRNAPGAETEE